MQILRGKKGFNFEHNMRNLLNYDLINEVNNSLRNKYQTYGYHFVHNNNIITEKLWKDGLHLTNSGKGIIINNYVQSYVQLCKVAIF